MRTVTVRYIVPVYVTVDIDAEPQEDIGYGGVPYTFYPDESILRVWQGDESIVRLDNDLGRAALLSGDVIDVSYEEGAVDPSTLTDAEREKALDVAEGTAWPAWERG